MQSVLQRQCERERKPSSSSVVVTVDHSLVSLVSLSLPKRTTDMLRPLLAGTLALLASTATATLAVRDGKLSVVDSVSASLVGSTALTEDYRYQLTDTDSLKLQFTVTRDGNPFQPQQAAILVSPSSSSSSTTTSSPRARAVQVPVKVRANSGKAKIDLDADTLAQGGARGAVDLTLLVGHPNQSPLAIPLGTISLPESVAAASGRADLERLPKHWEAEKYAPQPEIRWTFRGGENQINPVVALVGLAVVLAPWTILLATVSPNTHSRS